MNAARELLAECEELSILVSDKILAGQIVLYQAQLERREKNYHQALVTLTKTHYLVNRHHAYWLANMLRLEQARNLTEIGKVELASIILQSTTKKIRTTSSPLLLQKLYDSLSRVFMNQGQFQQALTFEKNGLQSLNGSDQEHSY